jgi:hypothetical protein
MEMVGKLQDLCLLGANKNQLRQRGACRVDDSKQMDIEGSVMKDACSG